jgi:hypothetical protein
MESFPLMTIGGVGDLIFPIRKMGVWGINFSPLWKRGVGGIYCPGSSPQPTPGTRTECCAYAVKMTGRDLSSRYKETARGGLALVEKPPVD